MDTIQPLVNKQKSLGHYVLFWWRGEDDWAQEDWEAAGKFIAKYKAVAGFSLTDAKKSKQVTIIGATSGVDGKAEAQLKQAGCKIQRLNGSSCEATAELLNQLVQNGNDFEEGTRYK